MKRFTITCVCNDSHTHESRSRTMATDVHLCQAKAGSPLVLNHLYHSWPKGPILISLSPAQGLCTILRPRPPQHRLHRQAGRLDSTAAWKKPPSCLHALLSFKLPSFPQEPLVHSLPGEYVGGHRLHSHNSSRVALPAQGWEDISLAGVGCPSHSHDDLDFHLSSTWGFQKAPRAVSFEPNKMTQSHCVEQERLSEYSPRVD